jgi:hypothetical protein
LFNFCYITDIISMATTFLQNKSKMAEIRKFVDNLFDILSILYL